MINILFLVSSIFLRSSFADTCAKVEVVSGEDCQHLKARFNLGKCSFETQDQVDGKVSCRGDTAHVTAETPHGSYEGSMKLGEEVWGQRPWRPGATQATAKIIKVNPVAAPSPRADQVKVRLNSRPNLAALTAETPPAQEGATPTPGASATPAAPGAPTPLLSLPGGITIAGLIDVYIGHNFASPVVVPLSPVGNINGAPFGVPNPQNVYHEFDSYSDQFVLNMAEVSVIKDDGELKFRIDIDFGSITDTIHSAHTGNLQTGLTGLDAVTKNIDQAVASYSPTSVPSLTFSAGKMLGFMGNEVLKARDNWNYSHSMVYAMAMPYYHNGFSVGYALIPSRVQTTVYLVNGWDTVYDNNEAKTVGLQTTITPADELLLNFNALWGAEEPNNNAALKSQYEINAIWLPRRDLNFFFDFLGGYVTSDFTPIGFNAASWVGFTIAAKKTFGKFYLSPRTGFYADPQGYTSQKTPQSLTETTLTGSYLIRPGFETRVEARLDTSTAPVFFTGGLSGIGPYTQLTSLLAVLFSI